MKKTLSVLLASILFASILTGCKDRTKEQNSNTPSNSSTTSNSSTVDSSTSSVSDSQSESTTSSSNETSETESNSGETSEGENNSNDEQDNVTGFPDNRAGRLVIKALSTDEWGPMEVIPDEVLEIMLSGFNKEWAEEYCFANNLISANLLKVYVVKPVAGSEDAVKEWFENYLTYCKEEAAFYPQQEVSAAGSVTGTTADGYYYLICHENGAAIADYMMAD